MRRIAAALTLTALVLAGCGGDDDEPTAEAEPTTEAPADEPSEPAADEPADEPTDDPSDDLCPYLTAGPLEDAFGVGLSELYGNEVGCQFGTDDGALQVTVTHIDIEIDPEEYAEESTASCDEGSVVEVDAGDFAYACQAIGPTASVFEGDAVVNLSVLFTEDEQGVLDAFVQVLPDVTVVS